MLTALLFSLTLAAPGDAIYLVKPGEVIDGKLVPAAPIVLDFPQKQELASAVASTFPGIKPASLDLYNCWMNPPAPENKKAVDLAVMAAGLPWPCNAIDANPTDTDDAALDMELDTAGACKIVDRPDGKSYLRCEQPAMNGDARILNNAFTQSVFGKPLNMVWQMRCQRDPEDFNEISCMPGAYLKIASSAVWRADRKVEGYVLGTFGRVAPAS